MEEEVAEHLLDLTETTVVGAAVPSACAGLLVGGGVVVGCSLAGAIIGGDCTSPLFYIFFEKKLDKFCGVS